MKHYFPRQVSQKLLGKLNRRFTKPFTVNLGGRPTRVCVFFFGGVLCKHPSVGAFGFCGEYNIGIHYTETRKWEVVVLSFSYTRDGQPFCIIRDRDDA